MSVHLLWTSNTAFITQLGHHSPEDNFTVPSKLFPIKVWITKFPNPNDTHVRGLIVVLPNLVEVDISLFFLIFYVFSVKLGISISQGFVL